ncbi:unnamed protein product [Angiostrongylus costaricensis]|uniref:Repulsive guidance molecule A n=1 Tax=Angiostrongylus costaricensis TaxID=334426 RepID=A0A158PM89_ANGCS|nr:unnamed protein product [Angiostrongylus costaricensis]
MVQKSRPIEFNKSQCALSLKLNATCRLEDCSQWFLRVKHFDTLTASSNEPYCQALSTYLHCLNDTTLACRGNLQFYTNLFAMRKQFREFNCAFYKPRLAANRCNFLPKSPLSRMRMCSLFGDPHLQRFDGTMQSCTEEGARPLVDNRHFLIQVTNANIRNEPHTTAVSKVTVLIRSHNCTRSLHYEASSDEETLPISFIDGVTHYNVDDRRTTVEIRANGDYVEIAMHHIHSSVHIRRRGPILVARKTNLPQIFVLLSTRFVPTNTLFIQLAKIISQFQRSSPSSESLCTTGCRNRSIIAIDRALAASNQFAKCYSRKLHVPIKLAIDRCRSVQVTDQYFDACVFDLMLTELTCILDPGDEYLVSMALDAQSDARSLMPDEAKLPVHINGEKSDEANADKQRQQEEQCKQQVFRYSTDQLK